MARQTQKVGQDIVVWGQNQIGIPGTDKDILPGVEDGFVIKATPITRMFKQLSILISQIQNSGVMQFDPNSSVYEGAIYAEWDSNLNKFSLFKCTSTTAPPVDAPSSGTTAPFTPFDDAFAKLVAENKFIGSQTIIGNLDIFSIDNLDEAVINFDSSGTKSGVAGKDSICQINFSRKKDNKSASIGLLGTSMLKASLGLDTFFAPFGYVYDVDSNFPPSIVNIGYLENALLPYLNTSTDKINLDGNGELDIRGRGRGMSTPPMIKFDTNPAGRTAWINMKTPTSGSLPGIPYQVDFSLFVGNPTTQGIFFGLGKDPIYQTRTLFDSAQVKTVDESDPLAAVNMTTLNSHSSGGGVKKVVDYFSNANFPTTGRDSRITASGTKVDWMPETKGEPEVEVRNVFVILRAKFVGTLHQASVPIMDFRGTLSPVTFFDKSGNLVVSFYLGVNCGIDTSGNITYYFRSDYTNNPSKILISVAEIRFTFEGKTKPLPP